jgi:hypothetical protein
MSARVGDVISEITGAANQQSEATQQVNASMSQISQLVQESSIAADHTASACTDLSNLALDLRGLVNQFRLDSEANGPNQSTLTNFDLRPDRQPAPAKTSAAAAGAD